VLICCSTEENCTSSVVKVLESIGDDGSWFFNCVINKDRKSEKLLPKVLSALVPLWEIAFAAAVVLTGFVDRILPLME
jgi:hypothetical protein